MTSNINPYQLQLKELNNVYKANLKAITVHSISRIRSKDLQFQSTALLFDLRYNLISASPYH